MVSRSIIMTITGLSVMTAALGACEPEYVYQPTVATTSAVAGRVASYYAIPPEAPRGSVQLATFGLVAIHPHGRPEGSELRAVHVRMVVSNNSPAAWTVDTREQLLSRPRTGTTPPAYAMSDGGQGPLITVPPLGKRTIDLFYPLPADVADAERLPAFDTVWQVQTNARVVAERTPFERLEVVPRYAYDGYGYDWGPGYNYYWH
jgi:hypothetical protein